MMTTDKQTPTSEDYAYQHRSYCTACKAFDCEDRIILGNSLIGKIAYIIDAE
jgi:hypothetical protein